jgi:N-acetyl-1-D-myo-inositol-2-amino-2-deoxy-alpha-D-glucopyranoside deacetylase
MSDDDRLSLMAVFAHPDDESFGIGGTLARYGSDPNVRVVLICATRGEAGEISDPKLASLERLGQVREQELRCACRTLGVEELYFLDYRDSGMAGTAENDDPRALAQADFGEAVGKVVAHIRREKPDVVVTFDENGGYGHPDHIAIHHIAKAAFAAAAEPRRYEEQIEDSLQPHQASKLYFTAIPRRFFRSVVAKMEELGMEVPARYRERQDSFGLPDDSCTTDIYVQDFWDTKQEAVMCHATQLSADSIFATLPPDIMRELQAWECFQLAESFVGEDEDSHDLFAGLG